MNCFLCSRKFDDDYIREYIDLYRIFEHFKVEVESEKLNILIFSCKKCELLADTLTRTLESFDAIKMQMETKLENFAKITKLNSTKNHADYERACDKAKYANREFKSKDANWKSDKMQPKLILKKFDAHLTPQDRERGRREYKQYKRYGTAFLCGHCKPPRNSRLYTCKQQLERHKFEFHLTEMFQEVNPDNWTSGFFRNDLIEFIDKKIESLKSTSLDGKRSIYNCDYCFSKHELTDENEMYFHLVELHRWDLTKYFKQCMNTAKEKRSWGVITPHCYLHYVDPKVYPLAWWQKEPNQKSKRKMSIKSKKNECKEITWKSDPNKNKTIPMNGKKKAHIKKTKIRTKKSKFSKTSRRVLTKVGKNLSTSLCTDQTSPLTSLNAGSSSSVLLADGIKIESSDFGMEEFETREALNSTIEEDVSGDHFEASGVFPAFNNPSKREID